MNHYKTGDTYLAIEPDIAAFARANLATDRDAIRAAVDMLNRKQDCFAVQFSTRSKEFVEHLTAGVVVIFSGLSAAGDIGIKAYGKIDFLRKNGFIIRTVYHKKDFDAIKQQQQRKPA